MDPEEDKEEKWTPFPSQKGKQHIDKSETKTKESIFRVKLTSFMSMVFCASARTTTFTLFLLAVLLIIEDRDFCTTSFPRYPPKLDFDDIVVVVNELAAANIVVVVVVLSVVVYVVSLCVCVRVCSLMKKEHNAVFLNWNHQNVYLGF